MNLEKRQFSKPVPSTKKTFFQLRNQKIFADFLLKLRLVVDLEIQSRSETHLAQRLEKLEIVYYETDVLERLVVEIDFQSGAFNVHLEKGCYEVVRFGIAVVSWF